MTILSQLAKGEVWESVEEPDWWTRGRRMPTDLGGCDVIEKELREQRDSAMRGLRLRVYAHIAGGLALSAEDRIHPEAKRLLKAYMDTGERAKGKPKKYESLKAFIYRPMPFRPLRAA